MSSTKEKILTAALSLFNENGMVNVRLQHIADEAFISVGNLAYHFANKEAIITALYRQLTRRQRELLAEYRIVPLFDLMDRLFVHTYQLQAQYVFFYMDTLEIVRAYPDIAENHRQHIAFQIDQLAFMLDFNLARGVLRPEPLPGVFAQLARQLWMTMDFWWTQHTVCSQELSVEQAFRRAVWGLLIPYFSKLGMLEYRQMLDLSLLDRPPF